MLGSRDDSGMDADYYSGVPKDEFVGMNDGIKPRIEMTNLLKTAG